MPAIVPGDVEEFVGRLSAAMPDLRAWVEAPGRGGDWWVETRSPSNAIAWRSGKGFGFFAVDGEEPSTWVADVPGAVAHALSVMTRGRLPA